MTLIKNAPQKMHSLPGWPQLVMNQRYSTRQPASLGAEPPPRFLDDDDDDGLELLAHCG